MRVYLAPPDTHLAMQPAASSPPFACFMPQLLSLTTPLYVFSAAHAKQPNASSAMPNINSFLVIENPPWNSRQIYDSSPRTAYGSQPDPQHSNCFAPQDARPGIESRLMEPGGGEVSLDLYMLTKASAAVARARQASASLRPMVCRVQKARAHKVQGTPRIRFDLASFWVRFSGPSDCFHQLIGFVRSNNIFFICFQPPAFPCPASC